MTDLFPKGEGDCGAHEWYQAETGTWRCYHCEPGVTHECPWPPQEAIELRLAALRNLARSLEHKPADEAGDEYREIIHEVMELLDDRRALAGAPRLESGSSV